MRQSITTKYLGPTNNRGTRIKAVARKAEKGAARWGDGFPAQALTVPYTHEATEAEHCKGAKALAEKLGWSGLWVGGGNVDEDGYVFTNLPGDFSLAYALTYVVELAGENRDWFFVKRQCNEDGYHETAEAAALLARYNDKEA